MASKPKKRKPGRKTPPMTREMLLPTTVAAARDVSLRNHMALVAMRRGHGNVDLAGELLKTVYLTYFLAVAETCRESVDALIEADLALRTSISHAVVTNEWRLEEVHCRHIEVALRMHDTQLASLPLHRVKAAKARLTGVLELDEFPRLATTCEGQHFKP